MDRLKEYLSFLPIITPLIYILGFIVINAHVSHYGFSDYKLLSLTYLKAGLLFAFITGLIFLGIRLSYSKTTMTDNLNLAWFSILASFHNSLLLYFVLFLFSLKSNNITSGILKHELIFIFCALCLITYFVIRASLASLVKKFPKYGMVFFLLLSLILLFIPLILGSFLTSSTPLVFILGVTFYLTVSVGEWGDGNFKSRIVSDLIVGVIATFFFGYFIYGMIPNQFGGGAPYRIAINGNKDLPQIDTVVSNTITLNVLYENDDWMLVQKKDEKIMMINRSTLKSYILLNP